MSASPWNWRERFQRFAGELAGAAVYVTVDLDCLRAEEAVTNWESGLFTADADSALGALGAPHLPQVHYERFDDTDRIEAGVLKEPLVLG